MRQKEENGASPSQLPACLAPVSLAPHQPEPKSSLQAPLPKAKKAREGSPTHGRAVNDKQALRYCWHCLDRQRRHEVVWVQAQDADLGRMVPHC